VPAQWLVALDTVIVLACYMAHEQPCPALNTFMLMLLVSLASSTSFIWPSSEHMLVGIVWRYLTSAVCWLRLMFVCCCHLWDGEVKRYFVILYRGERVLTPTFMVHQWNNRPTASSLIKCCSSPFWHPFLAWIAVFYGECPYFVLCDVCEGQKMFS